MKKRDPFLNYSSAEMRACLEDCCAADLGLHSDYNGLVSRYIVEENFSSFFRFYPYEFGSFQIDDVVSNIEHAIECILVDCQYCAFMHFSPVKISTKNYTYTQKERWDLINIACKYYLGLPILEDEKSCFIINED